MSLEVMERLKHPGLSWWMLERALAPAVGAVTSCAVRGWVCGSVSGGILRIRSLWWEEMQEFPRVAGGITGVLMGITC